MYEHYWIYAQKVGTKSFGGKPVHVIAENGKVLFGSHKDEDVKARVATIVKDLQESGAYSRVAIKNGDKRGYIYDWHMESEKLQVQGMGYAEYQRKRKALKAQIKALEAQIAELDEEWYKG